MRRFLPSVPLLAALAAPVFAQGTPVLENRIASSNPCAGLPGIDRLDFVRVDRVALVAQGDELSGTLTGAIGCRTSASALLQSSLATDIEASVVVSLSQCSLLASAAVLSNIRGSAAPLLDLVRPAVESALQDEIGPLAIAACRDMTAL